MLLTVQTAVDLTRIGMSGSPISWRSIASASSFVMFVSTLSRSTPQIDCHSVQGRTIRSTLAPMPPTFEPGCSSQ